MKGFFSLNNPLMQLLSRACDVRIVNVLFLISCVPIFTIGAAISGMHKVCQAIVMDDGVGILKHYISGFKANFKQATIIWLVSLVVVVGLVCFWLLITNFCTGTLAVILYIVLAIAALSVMSLLVYLFPLVVRYENTLQEHMRNALILSITRPLLTIVLNILSLVPFVLPIISFQAFMQTLIFWVILGFGFLCYMANITIKPVFIQLEAKKED